MITIKAKEGLGTTKKISGQIKVLEKKKGEVFSFKDLQEKLKGKILVCSGKISRDFLQKAMALEALGIVCQSVADEELKEIKNELKAPWLPVLFALLLVDGNELIKILKVIDGKMATIETEKKRLVINNDSQTN